MRRWLNFRICSCRGGKSSEMGSLPARSDLTRVFRILTSRGAMVLPLPDPMLSARRMQPLRSVLPTKEVHFFAPCLSACRSADMKQSARQAGRFTGSCGNRLKRRALVDRFRLVNVSSYMRHADLPERNFAPCWHAAHQPSRARRRFLQLLASIEAIRIRHPSKD